MFLTFVQKYIKSNAFWPSTVSHFPIHRARSLRPQVERNDLERINLESPTERAFTLRVNDDKPKVLIIIGDDQAAYDIRLVDMERDGDLDALIAGQQSKNVVWYETPLK